MEEAQWKLPAMLPRGGPRAHHRRPGVDGGPSAARREVRGRPLALARRRAQPLLQPVHAAAREPGEVRRADVEREPLAPRPAEVLVDILREEVVGLLALGRRRRRGRGEGPPEPRAIYRPCLGLNRHPNRPIDMKPRQGESFR